MIESKKDLSIINSLMHRKQSFAFYRLPEQEKLCFLTQTKGEPEAISNMESIHSEPGFILAPFRIKKGSPAWRIRPDYMDTDFPLEIGKESNDRAFTYSNGVGERKANSSCRIGRNEISPSSTAGDFEQYASCFRSFIEPLRKGIYDKLVLSRRVIYPEYPDFSPEQALYEACRRYVHSYVYLCYTPQTGIWLGGTPEILLSGKSGCWNTVALAGTMSLENGQLPEEWSNKNKEEQQCVTDYIRKQLRSVGITPEEHGPYPIYAGALSHLKTDFHFHADTARLSELLKVLHPTPAVCGLPKEKAYRFIKENEGYDRNYYSGFVGMLNPKGKTDLYVNLRCLNYQANELSLYAGSGLLPASELEDEWQETEKKLQTMKQLLFSE